MHAKLYVKEKMLKTSAGGEYMEAVFLISVLDSNPTQFILAINRETYDSLEVGKEYALSDTWIPVCGIAFFSDETATESDTVPPTAEVPECGPFDTCILPLGHEGEHSSARARETTPALESAQGEQQPEGA